MPKNLTFKPVRTQTRKSPQGKGYQSRAVTKALELLDVLGSGREDQSLTELAAAVKLTKTSAYRLLFTLQEAGYVERNQESRYALRGHSKSGGRDKLIATLLAIAPPYMRELTREFRETTGLAVLFDNHIEVIAVFDSPQSVRMGNTVGRILQPHASSLGKCITAFQPEQRRENLLRSYGVSAITPNTITDENILAQEFAAIRAQEYATDRGETCDEGYCFGAPIRNSKGEVVAAMSISIPKARLETMVLERIIAAIKRAAQAISNDINQ